LSSLPSATLLSTGFISLSVRLPHRLERGTATSAVTPLVMTGAGSGIKVGRIAGVGPGMGRSDNVNISLESLSEDGDVHKGALVLASVPVILLVDVSLEGDVNVL